MPPPRRPRPQAAQAPIQAPTSSDQIRAAATPSEAVAAYARLAAKEPDNVDLEHAYVRKMVDFGMPELADTQAHDLINRNAGDGLSIGVAAYMSAAKGENGAAVQQLKIALSQSPDEPFLLRTAGQLVAWYDGQSDRSRLTPTDVAALEAIRASANGKQVFADAYRIASPATGAATQPSSDATSPIYPQQSAAVYPQTTYVSTYYYDSGYPYWYGYYPIFYTNPFTCVIGQPWHHHGFHDDFHDGFHGGFHHGFDGHSFVHSGVVITPDNVLVDRMQHGGHDAFMPMHGQTFGSGDGMPISGSAGGTDGFVPMRSTPSAGSSTPGHITTFGRPSAPMPAPAPAAPSRAPAAGPAPMAPSHGGSSAVNNGNNGGGYHR